MRAEPWLLADALAGTPSTFLHGDWKMGNLGSHPTAARSCSTAPTRARGPACADLGWYLALNRARLPESKEAAIDRFRAALERHGVATAGWWDRQLDLCLLGTLVQFGWEKALGDDAELGVVGGPRRGGCGPALVDWRSCELRRRPPNRVGSVPRRAVVGGRLRLPPARVGRGSGAPLRAAIAPLPPGRDTVPPAASSRASLRIDSQIDTASTTAMTPRLARWGCGTTPARSS